MPDLPRKLHILHTVQDNQRYATFCATYNGKRVFVKQRKTRKGMRPGEGIQREIWGLQTFHALGQASNFGFEVPKILFSGTDYVVTDWAEGTPLLFDPSSNNFDNQCEFFARSLVAIDKSTRFAHHLPAKFDMKFKHAEPGLRRLHVRLHDVAYTSFFEDVFIERCFRYIHDRLPQLEARLTHPDITPNNILECAEKKTLIDYESASLLWPRFYDLTNLTFNRLITEPSVAAGCLRIIERYFELHDEADADTCYEQLNAIAMFRALSFIWELMTEPNAQHNTALAMTAETASRLRTSMRTMLAGKPYFEAVQ